MWKTIKKSTLRNIWLLTKQCLKKDIKIDNTRRKRKWLFGLRENSVKAKALGCGFTKSQIVGPYLLHNTMNGKYIWKYHRTTSELLFLDGEIQKSLYFCKFLFGHSLHYQTGL